MTTEQAVNKLLSIARAEIGYHESGNNYTKYAAGNWDNQFYGWELQNQPWCDVFVDWCFCQAFGLQNGAAMTYQTVGSGSAACSVSASYYQSHGAYTQSPQPGDQVFFYVSGGVNHTGIVETVTGSGNSWTSITTIEGNSSDSVARRSYSRGNGSVAGFGRPKWSIVAKGSIVLPDEDEEPQEEQPTIPSSSTTLGSRILRKGMTGDDVKQLQEKLIALDYDCGPDGADGDFGRNTEAAVKKFQQDYKAYPVDGEVGPVTLTALNNATTKKTTFKRGDIVEFIGDTQYLNAITTSGIPATPGKARISMISNNANTKHPYHIIHVDSTSNVYGWVDADKIKKD